MSTWTSDELDKIGEAEELDLASVRRDGTIRRPVTVWVVRDGDDIYVRSVNGRNASWFRGAKPTTKRASAYEAKYRRRYPTIVPSIVAPGARAATLKLVPR